MNSIKTYVARTHDDTKRPNVVTQQDKIIAEELYWAELTNQGR